MKPEARKHTAWARPLRRRLRLPFGSRRVKDRLFCFIFERDRAALLQLYNALNGTDYRDEGELRIVTLENVVYMSMNNDVAFVVAGTMNLYEHQSTVCPNMPLRCLLYLSGEFEALLAEGEENVYGSGLVRLPAPRCVVFYNGEQELPEEQYLRLTDAFTDGEGRPLEACMELVVRVVNINRGHNKELMDCCGRLRDYSVFVDRMREYRKQGCSVDKAIDRAVEYCIEKDILKDVLLPMRAEVKKMLLTEYDEKKVMRMFRREGVEEGRREGLEEGRREGLEEGKREGYEEGKREGFAERDRLRNRMVACMAQNGVPVEEIAEAADLSVEEAEKILEGNRSKTE